ncbi:MAG: pseudouridine synthase [archaeon]|nr:pseudouridine synthase [archaeon]
MLVSLERALSKLGYCSRSKATDLIVTGKVAVDGKTITSPAKRINLESSITVDGKEISKPKIIWIMLNKPKSIVTTAKDPEGRKTVYDIVKVPYHIFPVGRLDYDTSGMLLMTNDNDLAEHISSPNSKVEKTYLLKVKGNPNMTILEKGAVLSGELLKPKKVKLIKSNPNSAIIEMTITEGRNRQIRRMLEAAEIKLLSLKRIAIGHLELGDLKPGRYRILDVDDLKKMTQKK